MYYTGNRSVSLATNWIFDHPELDLETPLEEELRKLEAEEDEDDALDEEDEDENDSDEEALLRHNELRAEQARQRHLHHVTQHGHAAHYHPHHSHCAEDEDEDEEGYMCSGHGGRSHSKYYDDSDEESDTDSDDFDEEDIPEFKMVFVVNTSLEMGAGKVAAQVGHAALGVQRTLAAKSKEGKFKVSMSDLGLWQDFG